MLPVGVKQTPSACVVSSRGGRNGGSNLDAVALTVGDDHLVGERLIGRGHVTALSSLATARAAP
jgi:hypothetical protein